MWRRGTGREADAIERVWKRPAVVVADATGSMTWRCCRCSTDLCTLAIAPAGFTLSHVRHLDG